MLWLGMSCDTKAEPSVAGADACMRASERLLSTVDSREASVVACWTSPEACAALQPRLLAELVKSDAADNTGELIRLLNKLKQVKCRAAPSRGLPSLNALVETRSQNRWRPSVYEAKHSGPQWSESNE